MSGTFQLVRYRKSDREEVFRFLRAVHPAVESDRLMKQWDWKYDANPFNLQADPYILLWKASGKVIGMMGGIPLRVSIAGQEHWVSCACDMVADYACRGRGFSRRIIKQYVADNPLSFAFLNDISHRAVTLLRIMENSCRLPLMVKPLDFGQLLRRATGKTLIGRWAHLFATGAQYIVRPFRAPRVVPGVIVTQVDAFDDRVDLLCQQACRAYPVIVVRDQQYLNWRFVQRPEAAYTLLVASRGPDLVRYLVLRVSETAGVRWGFLVDVLVEEKSPSILGLLVAKAAERSRQEGAETLSCLATTQLSVRTLYRQGFYPWRWGQWGYFGAVVSPGEASPKVFGDSRQWFLTMGDGDLEMAF